ncbi:MAG: sigma-70 family RNA polymerase sigma factor [Kiritimatiellae bacterium]|nr:sigma-70 family RNA polymerase sigma factor [Kiritimatiellia bacterium]MBQ3098787.1 sigma-70 family RNA polymerase sigma factor [Kiritimatiellia bacterium]
MTYRHFNNETTRSSVLRAVADTENEAAWQRLFDLYAGFVFSIARSKGLNDSDADDIVQTVFADLARNLPTFEYDRAKGRFRSHLSGLVHWRVNDRLRSGKRDAELKSAFWEEAKSAASAEDEDFEEREWQQAALEEALRRIKPEVRPEHYATFVASAVEGQDTDVVTKLYGISRDSLYQIRKRLTVKLHEKLAEVRAEMDAPCAPGPRP